MITQPVAMSDESLAPVVEKKHSTGVNGNFERLMNKKIGEESHVSPSAPLQIFHPKFAVTIQDYFKKAMPAHYSLPTESLRPMERVANSGSGAVRLSAAEKERLTPEIKAAINEAEKKYGVPHKVIEAVIHQESGFNPKAVSKVGARGLMQLMPQTAKEMGVKDAFDVHQNVDGGVKYLKNMLDEFHQDLSKALAAYNAGPNAVKRYGGVPPYSETRNYVASIMAHVSRA